MKITSAQTRTAVLKQLQKFKEAGYRVYINNTNTHRENFSSYGLITDGTSVVYIQPDEPFWSSMPIRFYMSYNYTPNRKFGSGIRFMEPFHGHEELTEEDFYDCVANGISFAHAHQIPLYSDADDYFRKQIFKNMYVEI